jgi:hypothetical protein
MATCEHNRESRVDSAITTSLSMNAAWRRMMSPGSGDRSRIGAVSADSG